MCGIVGARHDWLVACGLDPGPAMAEAVRRLAWRGPDGQGVVRVGAWWLGCARLAISQANSAQPVVRRGGRFAGVLNGAVTDARDRWAKALPGSERRAWPPNDAWLPLLAVAAGDGEALATLRGHHAYAVVDRQTGELVFGQDRYGEKPLFALVGRDGGRRALCAFASTPAALRALGMPPLGEPRRLRAWFTRGFADPTPHRFSTRLALERLPARGVPLRLANREDPPRAWCRPWRPGRGATASPQAPSLRQGLLDGVARCADASVPLGLSLSGGIDSSCLAAALRTVGRRVPAFQFLARGGDGGERAIARDVATHCGLDFVPVDGGPEVLDALPALTAAAGLPLGDPSLLAVHAVARAAATAGCRILLSGEGADELFLGYRRYRAVGALGALPRLPWLAPLLPSWRHGYPARWLRAAASRDPAASLLAVVPPAFAATVLAPHLLAPSRRPPRIRRARAQRILAARDADLDGYLRLDLLPKVDVATMAAGVESRCPWLEAGIERYGHGADALGKQPIRAAFAADLPAAVFTQKKRGFALPLDRWFRGELPWLDLLSDRLTLSRPHLRPGGVARAVAHHRAGRANLGHGLYLLVACELHLRAQAARSPVA